MRNGTHRLAPDQRIVVPNAVPLKAAQRLQNALQRHGLNWQVIINPGTWPLNADQIGVTFERAALDGEHYQLSISPEQVVIRGGENAASYWNGVCTLIQLIDQYGDALPCLEIDDWPDFKRRGVMLDISRDRVPTLYALFELVDRLAGWKINELQLYTEHTFAYQQHPLVWQHASPMTAEQIRALDAYCQDRGIDLVPNQNSFGHMHRWLMHDEYLHLAELPEGVNWPFMLTLPRPFSISPAVPETVPFLKGLFDELLPNFSSKYVNIGCDETADLGKGRSKALVEAKGKGRVYLDFLTQIASLVQAHGRTVQFWGDIIVEHPDLVPELPKNLIAMEWGYDPSHPFDEHGALFAASGIPFYVCPGTSSWISLVGRTDCAVGNLISAARNGKKHGAQGYLNTDWGDFGHTQPLPVSYLGFAFGAALSWCADTNETIDLPAALSRFAFEDSAGKMGQIAYDLGKVYLRFDDAPNVNGSVVVRSLFTSIDKLRKDGLPGQNGALKITPAKLQAIMSDLDQMSLALDEIHCTDSRIVPEYKLGIRLFRHACQRLLMLAGDTTITKRALAADMRALIGTYSDVWLKRSRVGGLGDSLTRLTRVLAEYES